MDTPQAQVLNNMELTSIVFSFLRNDMLCEAGVVLREDVAPELPGEWTAYFAALARVDRSFFQASTDVLWETMDSVTPFLALLEPEKTEENGKISVPVSFPSGITPEAWKRFQIYATKTKTLILDRHPLDLGPCWFMYISTFKNRSDPLFPAVKKLFLISEENVSLFFAFSAISELEFVCVDFEGPHDRFLFIPPFTAALSEKTQLRKMRLTGFQRANAIAHISRIYSLTSLELGLDTIAVNDLLPLEKMTNLQRLQMECEGILDSSDESFTLADIRSSISRPSNQALQNLRVLGDGATQLQVARNLAPRSLVFLYLDVLLHGFSCRHIILVPLAVIIYTARNPLLGFIGVDCESEDGIEKDPAHIDQMRGQPLYIQSATLLLTGLSKLKHLVSFNISGIPFFSVDIILSIFKILPQLPRLEKLVFVPCPLTNLPMDELVYPPLALLEDISRKNPCLVDIETIMTVFRMPNVPLNYISAHCMKSLKIHPSPSDKIAFTEDETFMVARYLDRLFPSLKRLSRSWPEGSAERSLWTPVDKQLHFSQEIRAQTTRDFETMQMQSAT